MEPLCDGETKVCSKFGPGHIIKVAAMSLYVINL